MLKRLCKKIGVEERICIYKTIVAPHFEYCATINFLCNESQMNRMQKIQNRAMRSIMNVNIYTNVKLMLETLRWLSIRQRITYLTLKMIHKINMGMAPEYLTKMIKQRGDTHNYRLRNNRNIELPNFLKNNTQNSLAYRGFKLYNELPIEIRNENKIEIFSKKAIKWIKINVKI